MEEQKDWWRVIPKTDGFYEISKMGEVRSWKNSRWPGRNIKPTVLMPFRDNKRNWVVKIVYDGKSRQKMVMSLMVQAWYGSRPEGMRAYHINGLRDDNRLANIGFKPMAELCKITGGMTECRKPVVKLDAKGQVVEIYRSVKEAGRKNFMSDQTISDCCHRRNKRHKTAPDGCYYRFEEDMHLESRVAR